MGFGQVANWGQVTVDTIAETKKVVWRPATSTTVLLVGQPVCYNSDATADWKENASNRISSDFGAEDVTAYAEGSQNYNARLLVVEEPLTANLMSFAGVVKSLGPKRGADGDTIEIYVPKEGAVVPAYLAASVTTNASIVGIVNAGASFISGGRPIGIAMETIDRSDTNGMAWIKFQSFAYQSGTASTVLTGAVLNTLQHTFINTSGTACNMLVHSTLSGIMASGNAWGGLFYTNINAVMTGNCYIRGILSQMNIGAAVNGPCHISAIHAQLTGSSEVANIEHMCALWAEVSTYRPTVAGTDLADEYSIVKLSNGAPAEKGPNEVFFVWGGNGVEDLFQFDTCLNGGGATDHFLYPHGTGADAYVKNGTGAILKCKVNVDGVDYFIMLYSDPEEAT